MWNITIHISSLLIFIHLLLSKELVDACREKNKEKICHVLSEHYMRTIRRLLKEQGLSEEDSGFSFDFLV